MTLFSAEEIKTEDPSGKMKTGAMQEASGNISALGKSFQRVSEVVGTISKNQNIHYASAGEWSTHELLYHLLQQTGPAEVFIATWSMTETPARWLAEMITAGMISRLDLVLAFRTKNHHPGAYHLAKQLAARVRLTMLHAKVTVIRNADWSVSICGSANYTNNPRIEAGVISTDPAIADFHCSWIIPLLEKGDPFEME